MATFLYPPLSVSTIVPPGLATAANQATQIAQLQELIDGANRQISETLFFDYTGVSDAGYTEIIASTVDDIKEMTWFDSSGFPMVVALGSIGSEVDLFNVPPGGFNGMIKINIPAGSRVSIKELVSDTIEPDSRLVANFYK